LNLDRRRRGVSGIIAGLFVFVMLFTVGTGYFINQATLQHEYDVVNGGGCVPPQSQNCYLGVQQQVQAAQSEQLTISTFVVPTGPTCTGSQCLSATVANTGGVSVVITGVYVIDPTVSPNPILVCFSPKTTANPTPVNCPGYTSPISLNVGSKSTVSTQEQVGCSTSLNACTIGLMTERGRFFTQLYPLPQTSSPPPAGTNVAIITQLSPSNIVGIGQSVFDTAILIGATSTAGNTVTYSYYPNGKCTGAPTSSQTVTVQNAAVPDSAAVSFNPAGLYSWQAVYSGDAANVGATSPCEPLTVTTNPGGGGGGVTGGIGSFALDFNQFFAWICTPTGSNPTPCTLGTQSSGYVQVGSNWKNLVFSAFITNDDPCKRTITLNYPNSFLVEVLVSVPNSPKSYLWTIATLSGTTINAGAPAGITYGQGTTVYFSTPNPSTGNGPSGVDSVFLYLTGTSSGGLGGASCPVGNYGQTIPFVTTIWN
jgi:hypothetical protein